MRVLEITPNTDRKYSEFNKKLSEHEKEIRNLKNNAKKCKQEAEQYKLMLKNKPINKVDLATDLILPSLETAEKARADLKQKLAEISKSAQNSYCSDRISSDCYYRTKSVENKCYDQCCND